MDNLKDRHSFYMVEDDYLHLPGARSVLREGLKIGEYVTLYDHPDKYMKAGPNPHVINGAEKSQVFLSKSCHWKQTNSTTMTWATRVETLKQDREVWWANSEEKAAYDFEAFMSLDRLTISSIPGWSTHCETQWLTPPQDWKAL